MSVTVRENLQQRIPAFDFNTLPGAGNPSLSHKAWAGSYHPIPQESIQTAFDPDWNLLNNFFGPETDFENHCLDKAVNPVNDTSEWLQTEGDSVRAFYTHVSHPIQLAFHNNFGRPFVIQRSESGPLGNTTTGETIDFNWGHGEKSVMTGELKRHRIIDPARWQGQKSPNSNRIWLGRELRGYCHKYRCSVASVFDGKYLMILIFNNTDHQLRDQNCPVTCFIFSQASPLIRYGLFRAASYQLQLAQAKAAPQVTLDGYVRRFKQGHRPYWTNQDVELESHPNGYVRMFDGDSGGWYWAATDQTPVIRDGVAIWDTLALY